jgi:hypothetical protein
MLGAATLAGGFVAVGRDTNPVDRTFDAAVWRSADGLSWERVTLPEEGFSGPGSQSIADVVATATGYVAVGRDGLDAAAWRSEDGSTWERVETDALAAEGAQEILAVVESDAGLVAVGYEERGDELRRDAAVWVFDGEWRRVAAEELRAPGGQEMRAVAQAGGGFVAGGSDLTDDDADAAVWSSPDGLEWTRVEGGDLGGAGVQMINALLGLRTDETLAAGEASADAAAWLGGAG